jgi:integrase
MSEPIKKLRADTDLGVRAALKQEITKATVFPAGGGLYLRRRPGGASSWFFVSAKGGKRREIGLGPCPQVSLAEARKEARRAALAIDEGRDPFQERAAAKAASPSTLTAPSGAPTFGEFADGYLKGKQAGWRNEVHRRQWKRSIEVEAKALRAKRIDSITTDDVLAVLRPMWQTKQETASRLRGRLERVLDAAAAVGHRDRDAKNPATWAGHLEHFLPQRTKKSLRGHHKAVAWRDMPDFFAALAGHRDSVTALCLRFTILTAARTGEAIGATWREIDFAAKVWTVPAARMKMSHMHQVPLCDQAMHILNKLHVAVRPDDYIFPGGNYRKGTGHLSNMAMLLFLQQIMGRQETVHGFRSSFRDWAGDATDYERELAEMALAHAVGDATEAAYRRARALEKRRAMMADWAEFLCSKITPEMMEIPASEILRDPSPAALNGPAAKPRKTQIPGQVSIFED